MKAGRLSQPLTCLLLAASACRPNPGRILNSPNAVAVTTPEPTHSMIYVARTGAGIIVIDLGWVEGERTLRRGLTRLVADSGDVAAVFLTHAHRDHISGWRAVRGAPLVVAAPEAGFLVGARAHADLPSELAAALLGRVGPTPGEMEVRTFSTDTTFVFGTDTLRAFTVPGHTPGSAAYLFRAVLFVGDAMYGQWDGKLTAPRRIFTTDPALAAASLVSLQNRLAAYRVRWVCTAHARCAKYRKAPWRHRQGDRVRL